jgi:hypothetical protein
MRVRVKFRFSAETGEVEMFQIDDLRDGPVLPDHDDRHHRAALDVARVVESGALVEEIQSGATEQASRTRTPGIEEPPATTPERLRD